MTPSIDDVATVVARHFGVTVGDLKGPGREIRYIAPRFLTISIVRAVTNKSHSQIAVYFGKDVSTIRNATRQKWDKEAMQEIWAKLTAGGYRRQVDDWQAVIVDDINTKLAG